MKTTIHMAMCGLAFVVSSAGCGQVADDSDVLVGLQAVEPKAGPVTDNTVHVTCKVIGAKSQSDLQVEYIYGVADANGVAQEPLISVTRGGGFADLIDLAPNTTYAITFIARSDGKRAAFLPTLTVTTMDPISTNERFGRRVVPGMYERVTNGVRGGQPASLGLTSIEDASCPSGVALSGNLGVFNWYCVDFQTMTAARQVGNDGASYKLEFCNCGLLAAGYEGIQASCAAQGSSAQVCKDSAGQALNDVEFVLSGTEQVGGQTTTTTLLKMPQR